MGNNFYLVQFINTSDNGYQQATTRYEDIEKCKTAWHTACASYRNKTTTIAYVALILNGIGQVLLTDRYMPATETTTETTTEA